MTPDPQLNLTVIATATLERLLRAADYFATVVNNRRPEYHEIAVAMHETRHAIKAVRAEIAASDDDATTMEASR